MAPRAACMYSTRTTAQRTHHITGRSPLALAPAPVLLIICWNRNKAKTGTSTCSEVHYVVLYIPYIYSSTCTRKYSTKIVHPTTSVQIPHLEKKLNGNSSASAKAEMGHDTRLRWGWTLVGRYFLACTRAPIYSLLIPFTGKCERSELLILTMYGTVTGPYALLYRGTTVQYG